MIGQLLSTLTGKIVAGVGIALLLALAVQSWRLSNALEWRREVTEAARLASHRPKLAQRNVARQVAYLGEALDQVRIASAQARVRALENKLARESADEANRKDHEDVLDEKLAAARRAAAAFAAGRTAGGLCGQAGGTDRGGPGHADLPRPSQGPAQPDGPGGPSQLVGITRTDLDRCTVNSTRLQDARDWNATREGDQGQVIGE